MEHNADEQNVREIAVHDDAVYQRGRKKFFTVGGIRVLKGETVTFIDVDNRGRDVNVRFVSGSERTMRSVLQEFCDNGYTKVKPTNFDYICDRPESDGIHLNDFGIYARINEVKDGLYHVEQSNTYGSLKPIEYDTTLDRLRSPITGEHYYIPFTEYYGSDIPSELELYAARERASKERQLPWNEADNNVVKSVEDSCEF